MNHTITVGMVVWASLAALGVIGVIGVLLLILSAFADAFKD